MPTRPLSIGGVTGTAENDGGDSFLAHDVRFTGRLRSSCSPVPRIDMTPLPSFPPLTAALAGAGVIGVAWSLDVRERDRQAAIVHRTMVELLLNTLCAGDPITARHSRRVADLTDAVGRTYRFNRRRRTRLRLAALLHDLGKLDNDVAGIVRSSQRLSDTERDRVKAHTHQSADILEPLGRIYPDIEQIVESHHERWDGSGYPRRLKGTEIPLESRIISVADVFDAMTQPRSYHEAAAPEEVLRTLREEAGSTFDPDLIERVSQPQVWSAWLDIAAAGRQEERRHRTGTAESDGPGADEAPEEDSEATPRQEVSG